MRYENAQDIGLLFYLEDVQDILEFNKLVSDLLKEGKKVTTLAYFPIEKENPYGFQTDSFTQKNISLFGEIKSVETEVFINTNFDLLFYVNRQQPVASLDYILASSQAKYRIGKHTENRLSFFELMVSPTPNDSSLKNLISQMLKYTKSIQK